MIHKTVVQYFLTLIHNHEKIEVFRSLLSHKGYGQFELFDLIDNNHQRKIDKNILEAFLKQHDPEIKLDFIAIQFLRCYSKTGENYMDQEDFQRFINTQAVSLAKQRQHYEVGYLLYLMIIKQFDHIREEFKYIQKLKKVDIDKLFGVISKQKQLLNAQELRIYIRDISGLNLTQLQIKYLIHRISKNKTKNYITLDQFKKILGSKSLGNLYSTPSKSLKLKSTADKSSAIQIQFRTQIDEIDKELKKKLTFQGKIQYQSILLKKSLAFLLNISKKQKQINGLKKALFKNSNLDLVNLFYSLDSLKCQFLTTNQLKDLLGHNSDLFLYLYGNEGILQFSSFVKLLCPTQFSVSMIYDNMSSKEISNDILEQVINVMAKMSTIQDQHIKDLAKIAQQFKILNYKDVFNQILSEKKSQENLKQIFLQQKMLISELELSLLFRKYDRNYDGYIEISDFSVYFQ